MKIRVLAATLSSLLLIGCSDDDSSEKKSPPDDVTEEAFCQEYGECGPGRVCAFASYACIQMSGCAQPICIEPPNACDIQCGSPSCELSDGYPSEVVCAPGSVNIF